MTKWFCTWQVPEYLEWAKKINNGYLLVIARREKNRWFLAQAKLIFAAKGLPEFKTIKQQYAKTKKQAFLTLKKWKNVA